MQIFTKNGVNFDADGNKNHEEQHLETTYEEMSCSILCSMKQAQISH